MESVLGNLGSDEDEKEETSADEGYVTGRG